MIWYGVPGRIGLLFQPEISTDTLNALDWMLKNMTQAASKEDTNFLHQFTEVAVGPKVTEIKVGAGDNKEKHGL